MAWAIGSGPSPPHPTPSIRTCPRFAKFFGNHFLGSAFSVNPRDEAMHYEDVRTLNQYFDVSKQIEDDEIATAQARLRPLKAKHEAFIEAERGAADEAHESPHDLMRVLISWSGERSHKLALILRDWLPSVIQAVEAFVSSEDIHKGTRWPIELAENLERTDVGILCVVPNNVDAAWLNFEAGALSKSVRRARVLTLLFGLTPDALSRHPLEQFQATVFEKDDVLRMLRSLNAALGSSGLSEKRLDAVFERWWPGRGSIWTN